MESGNANLGNTGLKTLIPIPVEHPFHPILSGGKPVILDGGLATELEAQGHDLRHPLWSAKILESHPEALRAVHQTYFQAGADCLITSSYQASLPGLHAQGYTSEQSAALLRKSVALAQVGAPLIAASIGPYGAFLANGAEYRGNYSLTRSELVDFHSERWHILADTAADLLACETLPSLREAEALLDLLQASPDTWAWFSFTCRNGTQISDGTPFQEIVKLFQGQERVAGIGVNCTPPEAVSSLIAEAKIADIQVPFIAYPNSGEVFDGHARSWTGTPSLTFWVDQASQWIAEGASVIGGCCRTRPSHIAAFAQTIHSPQKIK